MNRWQALVLAILAAATLLIGLVQSPVAFVPACQEDEVVVGTGQFHGAERGWDVYTCVNVEEVK